MKKQKKNNKKLSKRFKFSYYSVIALCVLSLLPVNVLAAENDPITIISNLSDFIFQIIYLVGLCIAGYGIAQFGMSFSNHDASQKVNGILFAVGGVIMMCAETILKLIAG